MTPPDVPAITLSQEGAPDAEPGLWFLNTHVSIRLAAEAGTDGLSVLEHHAPYADSPPLHIHHTEDECFIVLEGEFRFRIGDAERRGRSGEVILAPKGVAHTYRVESATGGHWRTVTARGDFERFVRAMSRPAERAGLPDPIGAPSPEEAQRLATVAHMYGIELVGPPLH